MLQSHPNRFSPPAQTILCCFNSAAPHRSGRGHFTAAQLPASQCTHISYGFVAPAPGGHLGAFNDSRTLSQLVALKAHNPALQVMAAIGGWSAGSAVFSGIVGDPLARARFVRSLAAFCTRHRLDGVDIVWQYPTQRAGAAAADRANFVAFLRELRQHFGWSRPITATVSADTRLIGVAYDVAAMSAQLSFVNLVTYARYAAFGGRTELNAPLYGSSPADRAINADATVQAWLRAGAAPPKILFGIPFGGSDFQLASSRQHGVGAASVGDGAAGPYTGLAGFLSYLEICERQRSDGGWTSVYVRSQQSVYAFRGVQWIGYDDGRTVQAKAAYAVRHGLGGVMLWAVDFDDAYDVCGGGAMPLLAAANSVIGGR